MSREQILDRIITEGAVALIRMADSRKLMKVAEAMREGQQLKKMDINHE